MIRYRQIKITFSLLIAGIVGTNGAWASSWGPDTNATNKDSIVNTRHNMTMSYLQGLTPGQSGINGDSALAWMSGTRNQYNEVCVYCHTPHGANTTTTQAPLWNHTISTVTYQTWATQAGTSWYPGPSSLICLGCHDGTVSIDSIINMPGSGKYQNSNADGYGDAAFLTNWSGNAGHWRLTFFDQFGGLGCRGCHSGAGGTAGVIPGFDAFELGKDLRNDHPVGVNYPATGTPNFNVPTNEKPNKAKYFGTDSTLSKDDIRLLYSGGNYKVECTSCHDPHGVPLAGTGSTFVGSFLRKDNAVSTLCLTCHDK